MNELAMALIAALGGGFGVKFLDLLLARIRSNDEDRLETRKAIRADLEKMSARVDALQASLDEWKTKYYELREENTRLTAKYTELQGDYDMLKLEKTRMQTEITDLQRQVAVLSSKKQDGSEEQHKQRVKRV